MAWGLLVVSAGGAKAVTLYTTGFTADVVISLG